ncbi:MAG: 3-hydroxybutyryl-CoA dehydrogenase, partial [Gemmatimonadetes bacterium]|nr:3-hydroxybutyryl-CoA dehydrogenase [Gemmatimonadota bacterium]
MKRIAVLGAGTMGHGIAQVSAAAYPSVALYDVGEDQVEAALRRVRGNLDKGVDRGKVTPEDRDRCLSALEGTTSIEAAVSGADLVIEAAPEDMDLKRRIFAEVARFAPEGALLATNTSSLSITRIGDTLPDPSRFLGLHFFNPVHIMALVEVVKSDATGPEALTEALAYVAA